MRVSKRTDARGCLDFVDVFGAFYCNGIRVYDGIPIDLEKFGLATPIPHISIIDNRHCSLGLVAIAY